MINTRLRVEQLSNWVKKYRNSGQDALQDGRGRNKAEAELTDADSVIR
ncbi:helix-turn-helix domain containing protein [Paenibacillus mendelii]|nr:helix-turn-helix domain containing protein [Paenibacillus mendelii]